VGKMERALDQRDVSWGQDATFVSWKMAKGSLLLLSLSSVDEDEVCCGY
jgi:hypothetical protein